MIVSFLLAAALPGLFVDGGPEEGFKDSGIACVSVPAEKAALWQGRCAKPVDTAALVKIPSPGVRYRMNEARASSAPWVDSNGWRFLRGIKGTALTTAGEGRAALAAAEAHAFEAEVLVSAPPKDWKSLQAMLAFLGTLPAGPLPALANIGFQDDGSPAAAENMNLMLRRNLLFKVVQAPDSKLDLTVKPQAGDPSEFAYGVRKKLTDEKRLLRLYGSEVVVARLTGDGSRRRVVLLNYGQRPAEGVRIRVLGKWPKVRLYDSAGPQEAGDVVVDNEATEFSVRKLTTYAVVEMNK